MSSAEVIVNHTTLEKDMETDEDEVEERGGYEDESFPIFVELRSLEACNSDLHSIVSPSSTGTLQRKGSNIIIESYYSPDGAFILPRDPTILINEHGSFVLPPLENGLTTPSADSSDNKWEQRVQNISVEDDMVDFDPKEHEAEEDEEYIHDDDSCHSIFKAWKKLQRLEQEIENLQQTIGLDHMELATLHQQVGNIHFLMGKHSNALESFLEALKIWRAHQAIGESYFLGEMATVMNTVGIIYSDMDLGSYGEEFFESATKIRMAMFLQVTEQEKSQQEASEHDAVNGVNKQLQFDPMIEEEEEDHELILQEIESKLQLLLTANSHSDIIQIHVVLGNLYFSLQRHQEAVEHLRSALHTVRSTSSPTHVEEDEEMTASILNNIGMVYAEMGWEEQSQECFEAVLIIRTRLFTPSDDDPSLPADTDTAAVEGNGTSSNNNAIEEEEEAVPSRELLQEEGQQKSCIIT